MDGVQEVKIGVIGGSGLAQLLAGAGESRRHEVQTPFGPPSDAIVETAWAGVPVLLLARHGPGHTLSPTQVPYRANIFALKQLGCTHVIASGAVGSLREEFKPRDLLVPDQIIDRTTRRAGTFFEKVAVHVEFATPFCQTMRQLLMDAASASPPSTPGAEASGSAAGTSAASAKPVAEPPGSAGGQPTVHSRGCYVAMEGPAFSTRAESLMYRLWGGDLIGMTAMPEAKLAREAELSYALLALVTDYDSWKAVTPAAPGAPTPTAPTTDADALLSEIMANLEAAGASAMALIRRAIELAAGRREALLAAPSRASLKRAFWSDKRRIDPAEIERLGPIWGRYFQTGANSA
jgi:5'-methylthioadenosine phosphorylase